jgi:hypothetical protein
MRGIVQVAGEAVNSRGRLPHVRSVREPTRSTSWRRAATALGALLTGGGIVGLATWVGCSIYNPSLLLPAETEGGDDVVVEAPVTTDAGPDTAPAPCAEVFPPTKPAADDPSDAGNQTFVVALHTLDLGIRTDGGTPPLFGFDLDNVFTCCDGGASSCTPPVLGSHCDENGGRDNSGGQLIASLALLDPTVFNSTTISERLQDGVYSLIVQVSDYNGQANDTQIVAGLYASDGQQPDADGGIPLAKWDGTDVWTIDDQFVLNGADASPILPNHFDAHAYVANGTMVMQVNFPLSLGTSATGAITIALTGGVITATVVPVPGGGYRLENGQVAGRWNASSVLTAAQSLTLAGSPICPGTTLYSNVKQQICAAADIATDPTEDNKGMTCDALSVAFGYTADPALMGAVISGGTKAATCGDAGLTMDNCTTP